MPLFGKTPAPRTTLFFATDVHGSERTFRKFLNAGKFYGARILIMGGDIIGKLAVPIIRGSNGGYRATLQGRTEHPASEAELKALTDRIGVLGFYSQIMDEGEFHQLQARPEAVEQLFHRLARQRLEEWIDLAETRLRGTGIRCYVTGGNDDYPEVLAALQRSGTESIFGCEGQLVHLDDHHTMVSLGFSTPTPWKTPREVSDEELGAMIDRTVAQAEDPSACVFNFHDPPVDSTLDTCPMLDWTTDPPSQIVRGGQVVLHAAGSKAVRTAIERHQPVLGLHGHIHESAGAVRIGRTLCINPGSEYGEGVLRGALVNLAGGKVDSYQMTSG
ncbi:MAG TPA: hypothetical protein VFI11_15205 [Anaerolineales bacterium]|nr:hypothetical protein [Anaerolineales bacterium]